MPDPLLPADRRRAGAPHTRRDRRQCTTEQKQTCRFRYRLRGELAVEERRVRAPLGRAEDVLDRHTAVGREPEQVEEVEIGADEHRHVHDRNQDSSGNFRTLPVSIRFFSDWCSRNVNLSRGRVLDPPLLRSKITTRCVNVSQNLVPQFINSAKLSFFADAP